MPELICQYRLSPPILVYALPGYAIAAGASRNICQSDIAIIGAMKPRHCHLRVLDPFQRRRDLIGGRAGINC